MKEPRVKRDGPVDIGKGFLFADELVECASEPVRVSIQEHATTIAKKLHHCL